MKTQTESAIHYGRKLRRKVKNMTPNEASKQMNDWLLSPARKPESTTVWTNHGEPQPLDDKHFGVALQAEAEADTTRQAEHSPLPWHLSHEYGEGFNVAHEIAPNCGKLSVIANVQYSNVKYQPTREEAQANAEYIVKACNNYETMAEIADARIARLTAQRDELLEALGALLLMNHGLDGTPEIKKARTAISNASK